MTDPSNSDIRITIGVNDTTVLSEDHITLALTDAKTITGSSDEISLRYYTCYIIADNWESIAGVRSIEGVSFNPPDADGFLRAYNKRVKQLSIASGASSGGISKVMMNKNFSYDETTNTVRPRRGGDDYY